MGVVGLPSLAGGASKSPSAVVAPEFAEWLGEEEEESVDDALEEDCPAAAADTPARRATSICSWHDESTSQSMPVMD